MRALDMMSCFRFRLVGSGHYEVTYTTPNRGDYWKHVVTDMPLIDATKGEDFPKVKDVIQLRQIVKQYGRHYSNRNVRIS